MKARVNNLDQILKDAYYLFEKPHQYDNDTFEKKYKPENKYHFSQIASILPEIGNKEEYETCIKSYINDSGCKMGDIFPVLRIALTGILQGPDLFDTFSILGGTEAKERILKLIN
jgi:glutamyl-tRNA synthetase